MNDLNVIETQRFDNCIIHICDNSFAKTSEKEKQIWEDFSKKAFEIYTVNQKREESELNEKTEAKTVNN